MKPVTVIAGLAASLPAANIDTDQIVPKQFLKTIERTGLARGLFYDHRFDAEGRPQPGFVLDTPPFDTARILVAGDNFGCGSSREHAPWALLDFGIAAVVSSAFADIFYNNSVNNGLLPAIVEPDALAALLAEAGAAPTRMTIDLPARTIVTASGAAFAFAIDPAVQAKLIAGRDAISESLLAAEAIDAAEAALERAMPWLPRRAA